MAFGQNASITRTLVCYPTTSGSSMLVEYRGSAYDVVALDVEVIPAAVASLANLTLGQLVGVGLSALSAFGAPVASWRLVPTMVRYCDVNGIGHLIAPTQGLVAGDVVYVSGSLMA
jgi:hypothetical protein